MRVNEHIHGKSKTKWKKEIPSTIMGNIVAFLYLSGVRANHNDFTVYKKQTNNELVYSDASIKTFNS